MSAERRRPYHRRGTNSQGNRYRSRNYGGSVRNKNPYSYRNKDSIYFSNADGSTYFRKDDGYINYTDPSGGGWTEWNGVRRRK